MSKKTGGKKTESTTSKKENKMSNLNWEKELNENGYYCTKSFSNSVKVSMHTKPIGGAMLFGPAGTGKSFLPEIINKVVDGEYFFYQCNPSTMMEDLVCKLLPSENTISGIKRHGGVIKEAIDSSNENDNPTILVLDEWDKTRPKADSYLLDFLQKGRINMNGIKGTANMDKLFVFITMNDERDLIEPLLRRLPKIDFEPLPVKLVARALKATHPNSKVLENALVLYQRCCNARLEKPCTIQELRQLLDAIDILGKDADWDDLVYQFITKTVDAHNKLARGGNQSSDQIKDIRQALDTEKFSADQLKGEDNRDEIRNSMPKLADFLGFDSSFVTGSDINMKDTYGIITHDDENYSTIARYINENPNENPAVIGESGKAVCEGGFIALKEKFLLTDVSKIYDLNLWGTVGEIVFEESNANMEDIKELAVYGMNIVKFSKKEIILKYKDDGIDLRWTPNGGAEIIVDLENYDSFREVFGHIGEYSNTRWISTPDGVWDNKAIKEQIENGSEDFGKMFERRFKESTEKAKVKKEERLMDEFCVFNMEWDYWTSECIDRCDQEDIPLWNEFLREKGMKRTNENGYKLYSFDGITFKFSEIGNDFFGMKITGKPRDGLIRYIKSWIPPMDDADAFTLSIDCSALGTEYFTGKYGFKLNGGYIVGVLNHAGHEIPAMMSERTGVLSACLSKDWTEHDLGQHIYFLRRLWKRCVSKQVEN